jgi:retron-type reverse transcriptase
VIDSYKEAFIQIQTKNDITDRIEIGKGVKQGCPLSPTLFNIGLDPLLRNIRKSYQQFGYHYEANGLHLTKDSPSLCR